MPIDENSVRTKLEKLIEHGRTTAWNPDHDVDWSSGSKTFEKLSNAQREALTTVLSLVYYSDVQGKQILTKLCRSLDKQSAINLPLTEKAHEFFVQQMGDEERHAYGIRLLFGRLDLQIESKAFSHFFYSKFLLADGLFDAKLILIYWYIEVLAKGIFAELKKIFPETCIDSLFTKIIRDEARHVGFGEIYIPVHAENAPKLQYGQMALAYYSTAIALPGLYRFSHYAKAAQVLNFDLNQMLKSGMHEIAAKAQKLPQGRGFFDVKRPVDWMSTLL